MMIVIISIIIITIIYHKIIIIIYYKIVIHTQTHSELQKATDTLFTRAQTLTESSSGIRPRCDEYQ